MRLPQWLAILLSVSMLMLAGCSGDGAPESPTVTSAVTAPEATEAADPTQEPPEIDECIECHNDQQRLIDTAAPEGPAPPESIGEG
jgi:hypothetical protein